MRTIEVKAAVIMALLFMILMRLVWMDMRSYVIVYAPENPKSVLDGSVCYRDDPVREVRSGSRPGWRESWSYSVLVKLTCRGTSFSEGAFVRYNQGLLIISVLACMLITRIISRSWVIAVFVGLALFSRGRLIASSGQISGDHLIMCGLSLWATCLVHWFRSGSRLVFALQVICLAFLVELELSFITLSLVPILYALTIRLKKPSRFQPVQEDSLLWPWLQAFLSLENIYRPGPSAKRGGVFRPLARTLAGPLQKNPVFKRVIRDCLTGLGILIGLLVMLAWLHGYQKLSWTWQIDRLGLWTQLWVMPVDRDVLASLGVALAAITFRSLVLPGLRAFGVALILGYLLNSFGVALLDHGFLPPGANGFWMAQQVTLWWEPLILTTGVLGFYHLMILALMQLRGKRRTRRASLGYSLRNFGFFVKK